MPGKPPGMPMPDIIGNPEFMPGIIENPEPTPIMLMGDIIVDIILAIDPIAPNIDDIIEAKPLPACAFSGAINNKRHSVAALKGRSGATVDCKWRLWFKKIMHYLQLVVEKNDARQINDN